MTKNGLGRLLLLSLMRSFVDGSCLRLEDTEFLHVNNTHEIQCWRNPTCIHWKWFSNNTFANADLADIHASVNMTKCRKLRLLTDWPTTDPHVAIQNFGEPVKLLLKLWHNKSVLIAGDSLTTQMLMALMCDIASLDFDMCVGFNCANGRIVGAWLSHYSMTLNQSNSTFWGALGPPALPITIPQTGTIVVRYAVSRFDFATISYLLQFFDVVLLNYGLHYGGLSHSVDMETYSQDMTKLFGMLNQHSQSTSGFTALVRETSAQHFFGTASYESQDQSAVSPDKCNCSFLAANSVNGVSLKNAVLKSLSQKYELVKLVPFYDLTRPYHDMHLETYYRHTSTLRPQFRNHCDCTHFCHSPWMWKKFFTQLVRIVHQHNKSHAVSAEERPLPASLVRRELSPMQDGATSCAATSC